MLADAAEPKYSSHGLSHTLFPSCWLKNFKCSAMIWQILTLHWSSEHCQQGSIKSPQHTIKKKIFFFLQCINCTPSDTWLQIALANNCTSMNKKFVWPKKNWSCLALQMNTAKLQLTHLAQTVLSGLLYLSLYTTHGKTLLEALDLKDQDIWANWNISLFRLWIYLLALCQWNYFTNELLQVLVLPLADTKFLLNTYYQNTIKKKKDSFYTFLKLFLILTADFLCCIRKL